MNGLNVSSTYHPQVSIVVQAIYPSLPYCIDLQTAHLLYLFLHSTMVAQDVCEIDAHAG